MHPLELVAITETWLNDEVMDQLISINEYNIFRNDRSYMAEVDVPVPLSLPTYHLKEEKILKTQPLSACGSGYTAISSSNIIIWLNLLCSIQHPPVYPLQEQMDLIVAYIIDKILLGLLIRIVGLSFSATLII